MAITKSLSFGALRGSNGSIPPTTPRLRATPSMLSSSGPKGWKPAGPPAKSSTAWSPVKKSSAAAPPPPKSSNAPPPVPSSSSKSNPSGPAPPSSLGTKRRWETMDESGSSPSLPLRNAKSRLLGSEEKRKSARCWAIDRSSRVSRGGRRFAI